MSVQAAGHCGWEAACDLLMTLFFLPGGRLHPKKGLPLRLVWLAFLPNGVSPTYLGPLFILQGFKCVAARNHLLLRDGPAAGCSLWPLLPGL